MRSILALVVAGGLSLGLATNARAQVAVGVGPWGGVSVVSPYSSFYSSGYYGLGGVGYVPGAAVYSSGYVGVAPLGYGYVAPYAGYYPAYGYYSAWGPVRRGFFGYRRVGGFW